MEVVGISGLEFTNLVLSQKDGPSLTLYVRNPTKLPPDVKQSERVHVVQGELSDTAKLGEAMSRSGRPVDAVVSFLGAYITLKAFLLRTKSTPIADQMGTVVAAMRQHGVKRILVLSTPAWLVPGERLPWSWWGAMLFPPLIVPQGHAEMREIAGRVSEREDLEWTVYRVPHLNDGPGDERVSAGLFGIEPQFQGTKELSRKSLVRWILNEVERGEWVRGTPMLGNY